MTALRASMVSASIAVMFAATAAGATPNPPPMCSVPARLVDPDTGGTNVRAGPSSATRIVARIPRQRILGGDAYAPELEIIGFAHGWARVRAIRFADYGGGAIPLFGGIGWISGRLLSATLTWMPVPDLPLGMPGPGGAAPLDTAEIETLDDCVGAFAHVRVHVAPGRTVTGWTRDLCANQVTTCSCPSAPFRNGAVSDRPLAPGERIFRRLDAKAWKTELCPDLASIVCALIEGDGARVIAVGYANVKAPELVVALDRRPAASTIAGIWAAGTKPDLILTEDGIGCRRHYCEIDWTTPSQPGRWSRALQAASFALRFGKLRAAAAR